jgi:L-amino acid N-acyltransferase YncA
MYSFDSEKVGPWVAERTGGQWTPQRGQAIGKLDEEGNVVCGAIFEDWNGANLYIHIAIEGKTTAQLLALLADYAFNQAKVKRLTGVISSTNKRSINFAIRCGFVLESKLRQATLDGDLLVFRLFKDECRYLKSRYAQTLKGLKNGQ